jgi:hypothetical protein
MRFTILILILVMTIITNAAKASDNQDYKECIQEQIELIQENEDSYSPLEIKEQHLEVDTYCKHLLTTIEQSSSK